MDGEEGIHVDLEGVKNSPAGRLLKVDQGEAAYWAFVPHPLPPVFPLDAKLVRTLSEADRALGELAGLGRALPNPHLLIGPFMRREAVLSSRIEGTQAGIADLFHQPVKTFYKRSFARLPKS